MSVMFVDLFNSATDEHDANEIKAESNDSGNARELLDLGNLGHHLGNSEKNADTGKQQHGSPDGLINVPTGILCQRRVQL